MAPNAFRVGFHVRQFMRKYTHNSKNKGHTSTFYLSHDCSTIGDIYSFGYSCICNAIGELWIQTSIETTSRYIVLSVLTLVTRKVQVVYGRSIYRMTALLSEMSIFCVRAGFEIQMANYASKHASQSLSDKLFLSIQSS